MDETLQCLTVVFIFKMYYVILWQNSKIFLVLYLRIITVHDEVSSDIYLIFRLNIVLLEIAENIFIT